MKKSIIFILSCLSVLTSTAQTVGEAFYIYRNDGQFNAFFRTEIDSIAYSNYDADGNWYEDVVTQRVYTQDSLYQIPLAAIDSVGFVTPETKYKPGVIQLEGDILDYIISQDSLTLFFNAGTPSDLLPNVGDKLITMEMTDLFPIGFAGEVVDVRPSADRVEIECTSVSLLDIFEQYYGTSTLEWNCSRSARKSPSGQNRISGSGSHTFSPGKLTLPLINNLFTHSYVPNDNLAFTLNEITADISVNPVITGRGFWIVDAQHGVYLQLSINGLYDLEENFGIKGSANWEKKKEIVRVPWPILPLADVYLELGGFVNASGSLGIQQKWIQQYKSVFVWEYSSKGETVLNPVNRMIPISSNHSGEATINGSIGAGVYLEIGLDFIHTKKLDIANVNLEGRAGVCLEGNLVLDKSDLENAKESTAVYEQLRDTYLSLNWYLGASANAKIFKYGISHDFDLGGLPFKTHGEIARFCLAPTFSDVKASYSQEESSTIDAQAKISCPALLGGKCLSVDAGLVIKDEDGDDVSERPYAVYDYKGSVQPRDLYSQFYNVSSVKKLRVYPHIKWMGVDILASPYADVEMLSCPDANHPHMIDLGLPSGTKWACCNVGATMPEGYGNYYAWGETQPKDVYNWDTYQYGSSYDNVVNIGSDIAGTSYDAATVNWGAPWRMPSLTQIQELLNKCSSEWTTQNGVSGWKFTGPNGGSIFLPAAGYRWYSDLSSAGTSGYFWSSSLNESSPYYACYLYFNSGNAYWGYGDYRYYGLSVRPVR